MVADAQFCLLMHKKEQYKPTNTGRLIQHVFPDTQVYEWHRLEMPNEFLTLLANLKLQPIIVFPEAEDYRDRMITGCQVDKTRKPLFILLDGTWRQARRMFRQSEYLSSLPVMSLTNIMESRYRLRKKIEPGQLCTAEVAAAMLDQIGDADSSSVLNAYFDIFNTHYRAARMSRPLPADDPAKVLINSVKENNSRLLLAN